jgi:hypothetical protein
VGEVGGEERVVTLDAGEHFDVIGNAVFEVNGCAYGVERDDRCDEGGVEGGKGLMVSRFVKNGGASVNCTC